MCILITVILALAIYAAVHEGLHALTATWYGEYQAFHVRPFGLEVTFQTPVAERSGAHWAVISGLPNAITILLGYGLLAARHRLAALPLTLPRNLGYWLALMGLLFDPLNLSVTPLLFGGDANGIAAGLQIPRLAIQITALLLFLLNRELVAQRLLSAYGVQTGHPRLQPWLPLPVSRVEPSVA